MTINNVKKVFVVAGESSGDQLGYDILKEVNKITNISIKYFGVGGKNLEELGLNSIVPIKELSLMGIFEIIPSIPKLVSYLNIVYNSILDCKPDLLITIDAQLHFLIIFHRPSL